MKTIFTFLLLFCFLFSSEFLSAQILNPSFENWTAGTPDHWKVNNQSGYDWITQNADAHAGTSSAKSDVLDLFTVASMSPIAYGDNGQGAHTSTAPPAVHGWYKLTSVSGDYFGATVLMVQSSSGTGTGLGQLDITDPSTVWKEFIVNIDYTVNGGIAGGDSIQIDFATYGTVLTTIHIGTSYLVDDLTFGPTGSTGIESVNDFKNSIESVYPNPSNDLSNIVYSINKSSLVTVQLVNTLGETVKEIVNEKQTSGRYKAQINNDDLPAGIYFVKFSDGANQSIMPLTITK